jgi:hypothetical protein
MREAVMTISGRLGSGSEELADSAVAGLAIEGSAVASSAAAGLAAAVRELGEHALKSAASTAADSA